MSFYQYHVFFCINQRENGKPCCQDHNATEMRSYAKQKTKDLGLATSGTVRINMAGCMNRCALGPVLVVYPEGVWYTYNNKCDIDAIIERHLVGGEIVEHLRIDT